MAVIQNNTQVKKQPNPYGVPSDGTLQSGEETQVANQPQNQQQVATGQTANIGQPVQQNQQQTQQPQQNQTQAPKLGQGVPANRNMPRTSRFQNLQKYISQNEGLAQNRLKDTTGQAVSGQAQGFRDTIQKGQQGVYGTFLSEQQRTGQEAQDQDLFQQAQQNIQQPDQYKPEYTFGDISQKAQQDVVGLAQNETDLGRFQQLRDKIINKAEVDRGAIQGGLQSLEAMRGLKEDPNQRRNLLRQTFGEDNQQYSKAAKNLDSFLLEQDRGFLSGLQDTIENTISSETPKVDELYNLQDTINQEIVGMGEGASGQITGQLEGQRGSIDEQLRVKAEQRAKQLTDMQNTISQKMQYGLPLSQEELDFVDLQEGDSDVINKLLTIADPERKINVGAKVVGADGREYLSFDPRYEQLKEAGRIGDVGDFMQMRKRNELGNLVSGLRAGNLLESQYYKDTRQALSSIYNAVENKDQLLDLLAQDSYDSRLKHYENDPTFNDQVKQERIQNERNRYLNMLDSSRAAKRVWDAGDRTLISDPSSGGLSGIRFNKYDNFKDFQNAYSATQSNMNTRLYDPDRQRIADLLDKQLKTQVSEEILNQASGLDFSKLGLGQQVGGLSTTAFDGDRVLNKSGQQGVVKSLMQMAAPKYDLSKFIQGVKPEDIYAGSVAGEDEIQSYNTLNDLLLGGTNLSKADQVKLGFDREGLTEQYMPKDMKRGLPQGPVDDGIPSTQEDLTNLALSAMTMGGSDMLKAYSDNPELLLDGGSGFSAMGIAGTNITNAAERQLDKALNKMGLGIASDGVVKPLADITRTITGALGGLGSLASRGFKKLFSDENLKENIKDGNKEIEELLDKLSKLESKRG